MNKHIYQLIFASTIILVSCKKDVLETIPNDRVSSNIFWKSENHARLAVNAIYPFLDTVGYGRGIFSLDALTDIGHNNYNYEPWALIESGVYDALNSKINDEWAMAYAGIRAANYFLENVDKVPTENTALINQFKGEAKTLRAYQYIKLAGLYGAVPIVATSISIDGSRTVKRDPVEKVWDFIDQELADAAQLLPASYTGASDIGRITKGAALSLKARADLFAGRFQLAADAAQQVMGLGYDIYSSYKNLFSYAAENNIEVILDKQYIKDNYSNNVFNLIGPKSQLNSESNFVPTKALVDAYEMRNGKDITDPTSGFDPYNPYNNRDPRLQYSIYVDGDTLPSGAIYRPAPNSGTPDAFGSTFLVSTTGFNLKKYINAEDFPNTSNCGINIILLRYAEVLLTYAEAKIELNQIDQSVYDAINKVRQRADVNMPPIQTGLSQNELREIVRHERMVELAFEGLRLFDIRRWRIAEDVMTGPVYGISYVKDGQVTTVQVVAFNRVFNPSRHYLWPIPQRETDLNPNLLPQNPGW